MNCQQGKKNKQQGFKETINMKIIGLCEESLKKNNLQRDYEDYTKTRQCVSSFITNKI